MKLYSHSNNTELNDINLKISELNKKIRQESKDIEESQIKQNPNVNQLQENYSKFMKNKQEETSTQGKKSKSIKISLLRLHIKCLLSIAKYRNEEISNRFYQYRILEFFTREIDLEYEISQIRERFLRIRNELKEKLLEENPIYNENDKGKKQTLLEGKVPSLNLNNANIVKKPMYEIPKKKNEKVSIPLLNLGIKKTIDQNNGDDPLSKQLSIINNEKKNELLNNEEITLNM